MAIQKIDKIVLKDIPTFAETVMVQMAAKEDEFYKKVMKLILKRDPTIEDTKDITLAIHPDYPNQELIAYKGVPFGRIIKGWDVGVVTNSFKWSFEPETTFK
jgi:hypothetical protein